jgi:SSS family transporter
MSWYQEHRLALVFLIVYTAVMIYHALVGQKRTKSVTDYYVGGRSMGGIALGISFFATYSSTNSFVGFAGQSYTYGAAWLLLAPMAVFFSVVAWVWIAPRLRVVTERLDSLTLPDYVGFRFGSKRARVIAALIVLFASFMYLTAVFKGIGNLMEVFLDIPYSVAIGIVFVVVVLYTVTGGFISVVKTDVVQGILMVGAAVLLFAGTTRAAGGMSSLFDFAATPAGDPLFTWDAAMAFPVLLGIIVAGTMKFLVEPRQLSRFYALKDARAVRQGMWVSSLAFLVVYSLLVPIGLYAHLAVAEPLTETDLVVPTLLSSTAFHPAAGAFLLIAMVAAAMSSIDSVLLVMASTCERDLAGLWRAPSDDRAAVQATRVYVALFAAITALIALNPPGSIVALTAFSGSLYAACFFPAVALGLYWRRGNGTAVVASFVTGIAILLGWRYLPFAGQVHQVFPAIIASTLVFAVLGWLGEPCRDDAVVALFHPASTRRPGIVIAMESPEQ